MENRLFPIPGYEGLYWIDSDGNVLNHSNHYMKPIQIPMPSPAIFAIAYTLQDQRANPKE